MRHFLRCLSGLFYFLLVVFFGMQLSACQTTGMQEKKQSVHIGFLAEEMINPNEKGQATPVNIRVYELKSTDSFSMGDYFTLAAGTDAELLSETKEIHEMMIKPGEKRELELNPAIDVIALGFVAAYRDINHADAMKTWLLPERDNRAWYLKWLPESSPSVQVGIEPLAVTIKEVD